MLVVQLTPMTKWGSIHANNYVLIPSVYKQ